MRTPERRERPAAGPGRRLPAPWLIAFLAVLPLVALAEPGRPLRVAVISDLNGSYGSEAYERTVAEAVDRIVALEPDLVISTGDMVAGQRIPHLPRRRLDAMWAAFHETVSDPLLAAGIPLAVTVGNHDGSDYRGFELERRVFGEQWQRRRPGLRFVDAVDYPFRYAFSLGAVLFVALDATTVGAMGEEQLAWVERVLEQHGRAHAHRVLFSHLPPWPFSHGRERETIGGAPLQRLLEAHAVDLYLSGHHHAFYPGSLGGVAFVSQACLGAGPRRLLGADERSRRAVTLLEFSADDLSVVALTGRRFDRPLDWRALPPVIRSSAAELVRADLAGVLGSRQGLAWR